MNKTTMLSLADKVSHETTVISIANQKGGVGKTTTAVNLAAGLKAQGKSVLCLDFDPQCNLADYLGHHPDSAPTITDLLFAQATYQPLPDLTGLIRTSACGLDYIPASLTLSKSDMTLGQAMFRERLLDRVLQASIPPIYDFVIIDCNPSMGILLTNALVASDRVLIPVQTEEFAVSGLQDMLSLIELIRSQINPDLSVLGLLPTMVSHNNVSRNIISELRTEFPDLILDTAISRSVEAPKSTQRKSPLAIDSRLGHQYAEATAELIARLEG